MGRSRKRSTSGSSYKEMLRSPGASSSLSTDNQTKMTPSCSSNVTSAQLKLAQDLLETLLQLKTGPLEAKNFLHDCYVRKRRASPLDQDESLISLASGLLTRAQQLESSGSCDDIYTALLAGCLPQHDYDGCVIDLSLFFRAWTLYYGLLNHYFRKFLTNVSTKSCSHPVITLNKFCYEFGGLGTYDVHT